MHSNYAGNNFISISIQSIQKPKYNCQNEQGLFVFDILLLPILDDSINEVDCLRKHSVKIHLHLHLGEEMILHTSCVAWHCHRLRNLSSSVFARRHP